MITTELDIVVPVYNEGAQIVKLLESLRKNVKIPFRVLLCYDFDEDNTLPAVAAYQPEGFDVVLIKNLRSGPAGAVITGLEATTAPAVMVYPADDDYNAPRIDKLMAEFRSGCDVVCASRFGKGGKTVGYPWLKTILVNGAGAALYHLAHLPTRDPTNGLRLFSGRVARTILVETKEGHAYSIELLVKSHRLGWRIGEVPVEWHERTQGKSRFRLLRWLPVYLNWFGYAFATAFLRRKPDTVPRRSIRTEDLRA